jgi:hypothetical protein
VKGWRNGLGASTALPILLMLGAQMLAWLIDWQKIAA